MSRNYEVQAEVFPCAADEKSTISDVLQRWGMEIECDTESFDHEDHDGFCWWGSLSLSNGTTEEDKHEELRVLLPDRALTTRWRWVDDQPWDDVIQTDPLKPAQT